MKDLLDSISPESTVEISSPGQFYGATWATILNSKSDASVTAAQIEFFDLVEEPITEEETAAESEDVAVESTSEATTTTEAQSSFFELPVEEKVDPVPEPKVVTPEPAKATATSKEEIESTEKVIAIVKKQAATETKEKLKAKAKEPESESGPSSSPVEEEEPVADDLAEIPKRSVRKSLAQGAKLIVAAGLVVVARNVVKAYLGRGKL